MHANKIINEQMMTKLRFWLSLLSAKNVGIKISWLNIDIFFSTELEPALNVAFYDTHIFLLNSLLSHLQYIH
jgi:hypothetical protein